MKKLNPQKTQSDSVIEELLTAFNNNPHNSNVVEYISRANYFDMIGKSRHEMVHSRIIAELLAGRYFEISKQMTLIHFLDIVLMRAKEQRVEIDTEFKKAVLTRSINIDALLQKEVEYPISKYLAASSKGENRGNSNSDKDSPNRLDIYLRYHRSSKKSNKDSDKKTRLLDVELFIENKVLSFEHDNQTQIYYDNCFNGRQAFQLFIYLSPISPRELSRYEDIDEKYKPIGVDKTGNRIYIHICYQDILDRVIIPLLQDNRMSNRDRVLIEEYINCLELPALPDNDYDKENEDNKKNYGSKELSIMAISNEERQLLTQFMGNSENARLMEVAISHKLGHKLYSYNNENCLTFEQALERALFHYTKSNEILKSIDTFKDIFERKGGGTPFLIYAVGETDDKLRYIPTHLFEYEYKGEAFSSIVDALKFAKIDYVNSTKITVEEVISKFKAVYKKVKKHQHIFKETGEPIENMNYDSTGIPGLFIRIDIHPSKLPDINKILGDDNSINPLAELNQCVLDSADRFVVNVIDVL